MVCRSGVVEKDSVVCNVPEGSIKPKGLFAEVDIPEGSFVCFLTGCWSLQPLANATFTPKHPSSAYVATWDKVSVRNSTRSGDRSMVGLVVISRTQHSGANAVSTQLCRQPQGTVRDMGALMNSQPPHLANCEAESVVLQKKHLKFDIPSISHEHLNLFYPAVFIKTTRNVRRNEELTWYYVVPGVPAFEPSRLTPPHESEASASDEVLNKWREGFPADTSPVSSRLVPRSVCGPTLKWSNGSWRLENDEIEFNTLKAFDPWGSACIKPDVRRNRKQDTLKCDWSGAVSECVEEMCVAFHRSRITFQHMNQTWGGNFVDLIEDHKNAHQDAPANASSSRVVHITYSDSNQKTKTQTLHIKEESKAEELIELLSTAASSGKSTGRCEATLSLRSKARRLLSFLKYQHTH